MNTVEKWLGSYKGIKATVSLRNCEISERDFAEQIWQAATAEADKCIVELKAKVSELDGMLGSRNLHKEHEYLQRMSELQAHINVLREDLEEMVAMEELEGNSCEPQREVLSKTPAQSLQEHDNELIEKCAKVCENIITGDYAEFYTDAFAKAIREMKGR